MFKDQLLQAQLEKGEQGVEQLAQWLRVSGQLPIGHFGDAELHEVKTISKEIANEVAFLTGSKQQDVEVSLPITLPSGETRQIVGWLKQRYASGGVYYRAGSVRSQDILSAWIRHLVASLTGASCTTHVIGFDKKNGVQHNYFEPLDTESAQSLFNELVTEFLSGLSTPLPYFPRSASDAMNEFNKRLAKFEPSEAREMAKAKFIACFEGNSYSSGEGDNYYIQRVWSELEEKLVSETMRLSERILLPAIERIQQRE
ncbi:exodeoxyribonuclease V gamma chain [Vibrio ishigakensis]|uniref:Exodeoxyribonuclease V gamma chain n=1 Tax=Vibrio ishigakensis TaxID=1481914 RepID=A0A0B8PJZ9_9VIBR|nr:exodeoxyribonuclease V gamma chain [Vibrio ishigakensis]